MEIAYYKHKYYSSQEEEVEMWNFEQQCPTQGTANYSKQTEKILLIANPIDKRSRQGP